MRKAEPGLDKKPGVGVLSRLILDVWSESPSGAVK